MSSLFFSFSDSSQALVILYLGLAFLINWLTGGLALEDEILHIGQAEQYLKSRFTVWDPMITTPPGLYLFTVVILYPLSCVSSIIPTWMYRVTNLAFLLIIKHTTGPFFAIIALSPILFPYLFLYYTDAGGLTFVLLAYRLAINGSFYLSALVTKIFWKITPYLF